MSTHVAASSQLFYSLATLVITKAHPRLAEDKLDEIEGKRAEVMRYGTKRTKYKNKLVWGFSCTVIDKKKIRTDTSVRMKRTKRPWEQEKMRVNYAGKRQRGTKLPSSPKKIQTVGATRVAGDCFTAPKEKIANWDEEKTRWQDAWRKKDPPTPDHLKVISDAREKH